MSTIGERIYQLRTSKHMNFNDLSEALPIKITGQSLSNVEKDKHKPSAELTIALSDYFDVSTDWILKGKEYTPKADVVYGTEKHGTMVSGSFVLGEGVSKYEGNGALLTSPLNPKGKLSQDEYDTIIEIVDNVLSVKLKDYQLPKKEEA